MCSDSGPVSSDRALCVQRGSPSVLTGPVCTDRVSVYSDRVHMCSDRGSVSSDMFPVSTGTVAVCSDKAVCSVSGFAESDSVLCSDKALCVVIWVPVSSDRALRVERESLAALTGLVCTHRFLCIVTVCHCCVSVSVSHCFVSVLGLVQCVTALCQCQCVTAMCQCDTGLSQDVTMPCTKITQLQEHPASWWPNCGKSSASRPSVNYDVNLSILLSGSRSGGQALGGGSLRQNECFYQIRTANKRGKAGKAPRLGGQIAKNLQPPGLQ